MSERAIETERALSHAALLIHHSSAPPIAFTILHTGAFMSWDIFVMDLPPGITSISDIPDGFAPCPLGRRSEIIAKLSALYRECDFTDPSWGILELPGCIIELSLGDDEELRSFAMHVRGDERAPNVVAHILGELGLRALDPSSESGLFEQDATLRSESFARWQSYRSQIAGLQRG